MPKLNTFDIRIKTGAQGRTDAPGFIINGFPCDFENAQGGTGAGEVFEAVGAPGSFAHALLLSGPKEGVWQIEETSVTYHLMGEPDYTIRFGPATLDANSDMNLWQAPPAETFDV